jgi:hypothetical protein
MVRNQWWVDLMARNIQRKQGMFAFENLKNNRPTVVSAFGLSAGNYLRSFWNLILLELRKGVLFGTPGLLSLTLLLCFVYLPHKYKRNRIFPSCPMLRFTPWNNIRSISFLFAKVYVTQNLSHLHVSLPWLHFPEDREGDNRRLYIHDN